MSEKLLDDKHIEEIEFLLSQSLNGFHFLFDHRSVAKVLTKPTEELDFFRYEKMDRIQTLFTLLIEQDSMDDKLEFLSSLELEDYEILLRTYFHLVENTLLASLPFKH